MSQDISKMEFDLVTRWAYADSEMDNSESRRWSSLHEARLLIEPVHPLIKYPCLRVKSSRGKVLNHEAKDQNDALVFLSKSVWVRSDRDGK